MLRRFPFLTVALALLLYASPYLAYRFLFPDAVLDYVGGHVLRPNWLERLSPSRTASFTFDAHSRNLGNTVIGESSARPNVVSRLNEATGLPFAEMANTVFHPLARLDHLLSGRYIRFTSFCIRPVFSTRKASTGSTSQPMEAEVEFDEIILADPGTFRTPGS